MKVYQVIRCSGMYAEYNEVVICTTLNENKAKCVLDEFLVQLEKEILQSQTCADCVSCRGKSCFKPFIRIDSSEDDYYDSSNCSAEIDYYDVCEISYKIQEFDVIE